MKRKEQKTQRGITLIALVITIIVLLILAGVAISMAINSDGLFGKANEATERWNTSVAKEQAEVQNLINKFPIKLPSNWDLTKIADIVRETSTITGTYKERIVPIPKGFSVSQIVEEVPENTIAGGLVIYQIPEGATVDWENSKITLAGETTEKVLQEEVNQYVWIPVDDINQMVMCKLNNANNDGTVCNMILTGETLKCETHSSTDLCGRYYGTTSSATESAGIYATNMNFSDKSQTWVNDSGYREPAILSSLDTEARTEGLNTFTERMNNDFINMATSVAKYGGFYLGRYEAGKDGESKKNQVVITAAGSDGDVYKGVNLWYGLYKAVHNEITVNNKKILQSHMIYGSQYDQVIYFLETNSVNEPQIGHSNRQSSTQSLSGANSSDIMNNIYDLEGNNKEWTSQANNNNVRVYVGGAFKDAASKNYYPLSSRGHRGPTSNYSHFATRASLYF